MSEQLEIAGLPSEFVFKTTNCWFWIGGLTGAGYGAFKHDAVHRIAYRSAVGRIPCGKYVLHYCDTPQCVNPEHLFLGTSGDNGRDLYSKGHFNANSIKTSCRFGHPFDEGNTYYRKDGKRACKKCMRRSREKYMSEHYTKNVIADTKYCKKCQRNTLHRVDDGRIGPCIDPGHKVPEFSQDQIKRRKKEARARQNPSLFE
jgi:hypothetical protein